MKQIINKLAFLLLFIDNLYLSIDLGFDFRVNYLLQFLFLLYFFSTRNKIKVRLSFIFSIILISIILFLVPLVKGFGAISFIRQLILISFQLLFCYSLLHSYNFDYKKIINDYLSIVYLICYVAIIQLILVKLGFIYIASLSYIGFDLGYFFSANGSRIQSWFEEPSFLAYSLTPALFLALSRIFKLHKFITIRKTMLILIVLFLSESSVGFLGILISLIIIVFSKYSILKKPVYLTLIIIIIPLTGLILYKIPNVKFRVDDTYELFTKDNVSKSDINKTNLSTYALYSNYRVTKRSFYENPLLGTGIGTYETNYENYINTLIPKTRLRDMYHINSKDANSLFMRLLVESGLIVVILILHFTFYNRIRFSHVKVNERFFWAFNNGIFVLIILRLLRQGHYTSLGFIMFLLLFYLLKYNVVFDERNN